MSDKEVRYQVKGIKNGRTFHVDAFATEADAIDMAESGEGDSGFERIIVVDEPNWKRDIDEGAAGILWDSDNG